MTIVGRIDARIAGKRLLDHPFYVAWSKGELTRSALQHYARQYYHWVRAFPTWLSATHANAATIEMRQEIVANLVDEEQGPENHPELWLRFCDALGLDREAVMDAELLPETRDAIEAMRRMSRDDAAVASLAGLYAYEVQQPAVMKTKLEGLHGVYGVTTGCEYFEVHQSLDIEHSAGERAMIAAHATGAEAAIEASTQTALDAIYLLLDGIERTRLDYRH